MELVARIAITFAAVAIIIGLLIGAVQQVASNIRNNNEREIAHHKRMGYVRIDGWCKEGDVPKSYIPKEQP